MGCCLAAYSQTTYGIQTGAGFTEGIPHLGLRCDDDQWHYAILFGTTPTSNTSIIISSDISKHFYGKAKYSDQMPVYFKFGIAYHYFKSRRVEVHSLIIAPRIGRDLNINSRMLFSIDAGLNFDMIKLTVGSESWFGVFPQLAISYYIRV